MAVTYATLFSRLGRLFGLGKAVRTHQTNLRLRYAKVVEVFTNDSYSTGTVAISSGVVTLSGGTFPTWAAEGVLGVGEELYQIKSRDSNTQITLYDTTATASGGTSFILYGQFETRLLEGLNRDLESRIQDSGRLISVIRDDAARTLIEMIDDDLIASNGGGLRGRTSSEAVRELIRQMVAASSSVDGTTITIGSVTAGSDNVGNGTVILSGLASQTLAPGVTDYPSIKTELIRVRCTRDAYQNDVSENAEVFMVEGQRPEARFSDEWPKGSGMNYRIRVANAAYEAGFGPGRNILRNSNFEFFTSNAPDFWTIDTGSAGVTVDDITTPFNGSTALKIIGNGSTAVKISQSLQTTGASRGTLKADTPYTISFAVRTNGGSLTAGNLKVRVTDSGGTTLNNSDANRKMEISIAYNTIGALTATYQLKTVACMTPANLPKGAKVIVETNTAFNSGVELYIDDVVVAEMYRPMPGNLACQVIAGSTRYSQDDEFTIPITNNGEGDMQEEFERYFNLSDFNYALPSHYGDSETISDNLIT